MWCKNTQLLASLGWHFIIIQQYLVHVLLAVALKDLKPRLMVIFITRGFSKITEKQFRFEVITCVYCGVIHSIILLSIVTIQLTSRTFIQCHYITSRRTYISKSPLIKEQTFYLSWSCSGKL